MTDRADQPGKVTCVSCADRSICRAHFTSSTFFNLLQQNIKHGKKHCSGLIVVIHRQRHHIVSFLSDPSPIIGYAWRVKMPTQNLRLLLLPLLMMRILIRTVCCRFGS